MANHGIVSKQVLLRKASLVDTIKSADNRILLLKPNLSRLTSPPNLSPATIVRRVPIIKHHSTTIFNACLFSSVVRERNLPMSRPRRNIKTKTYTIPSSDQSQDVEDVTSEPSQLSSGGSTLSEVLQEGIDDGFDTSQLFSAMPSQVHVTQTRASIHEQISAIGDLQEERQAQKHLTDELETQLKTAQRALFAKRASIAPLSRMPPEILALIFIAHVCDNLQSPWLLMQISRKWRSAALMTRTIWARIALTPTNWIRSETGPRSRSFEGMEVCITESQLIRALNRAGVSPLALRLMVWMGAPKSRGTHRIGAERVNKEQFELRMLLDVIPKHMTNPRLRSLQISTFSSFSFPETAFGVFDQFSFTGIQSLKLDSHYPRLIKKLANEATQPYVLHLPTESLEKIKPCKWWDQVDELSTMEYYHNFEAVIDIRPILLTATSLTTLSLSGVGITSKETHVYGHEAFSLPLLTHLHLTSSRVFWPIKCPSLTHLEIFHIPARLEEPKERSILLPRLVELVCCAEPEFFHYFRAFEAPVLRRLELLVIGRKSVGEQGLKGLWPLGAASPVSPGSLSSTIEPVIFKLYLTNIDSVWLARILAERLAVEEFISDLVSINSDFFEVLTPTRSTSSKKAKEKGAAQKKAAGSDSPWTVGCPRLKRLVIDLCRGTPSKERRVEWDRLLNSARRLVVMRSAAGAPLEKLSIRFNKEEEWKELVDSGMNDSH